MQLYVFAAGFRRLRAVRATAPLHAKVVAAATALLVSATACSSTPPDPDWVAKQWSATMLAYHIEPVYPPTEDIHIGDIYGVDDDASVENTGPYARAVKLDYVPMQSQLEDYYDHVPVLPDTAEKPTNGNIWRQEPAAGQAVASTHSPEPKGTPAATAKLPAADSSKPSAKPRSAFTEVGTLTKLPLMAFPEFTIAHADIESLGGSVPSHFFSAIFGASHSHQDAITIKIVAAETYGVTAVQAKRALSKYCAETPTFCSTDYVKKQLIMVMGSPGPSQTAVYLVDRLYLTRSIEYFYDTSTAIGAQGKILAQLRVAAAQKVAAASAKSATTVSAPDTKALTDAATALVNAAKSVAEAASALATASKPAITPKQPAAVAKSNNAKPASDSTTATPDDITAIKKELADLLAAIQANTTSLGASPGATFSIGFVSDQGISLVQTFERPIAIGYRAEKLKTE